MSCRLPLPRCMARQDGHERDFVCVMDLSCTHTSFCTHPVRQKQTASQDLMHVSSPPFSVDNRLLYQECASTSDKMCDTISHSSTAKGHGVIVRDYKSICFRPSCSSVRGAVCVRWWAIPACWEYDLPCPCASSASQMAS